MPIYVKYEGIKGDVTAEGYTDFFEVQSFQWGVGRGIGSPLGGSKDREASTPSVSEITVTKTQDNATTELLRQALWGEGKKVEIKFTKTDKDKFEAYLEIDLEECMISGYSASSGGDRPTESLSLNFTKITLNNIEMASKNEAGSPDRVYYDLSKGKGS
jgi:type VI secretion system secreted protein Hcp